MKNPLFHPIVIFQFFLLAIIIMLILSAMSLTPWYFSIPVLPALCYQIYNCVGTYRIIRNRDKECEKWKGMETYKKLKESE